MLWFEKRESFLKPTQDPGLRPAESQIFCHQGLLVCLGVLQSLIFQQRRQSISLLHHLQHLFQDQALLQQVLLILEAVCRAHQNQEKVEQKHWVSVWTNRTEAYIHVSSNVLLNQVTIYGHPLSELLLQVALLVFQLQFPGTERQQNLRDAGPPRPAAVLLLQYSQYHQLELVADQKVFLLDQLEPVLHQSWVVQSCREQRVVEERRLVHQNQDLSRTTTSQMDHQLLVPVFWII